MRKLTRGCPARGLVAAVPRRARFLPIGSLGVEKPASGHIGAAIKVVAASDSPTTEDVVVMSVNSDTNTISVRLAGSES